MAELNYKIDGVGERTNERVRRERNERFKTASLKKAENESAALDEIQTQRFYDTAVSYYNYREGTDIYSTYSHADILEKFYNDRSWRNNNTISMGADMLATGSDQPLERLQEFSYIQQTYEALPSWWDDPNRTFGGWLMDNGGAMLADPVNLIGFGVGGQAAKQAYKQALKEALKGKVAKEINDTVLKAAQKEAQQKAIGQAIKKGAIYEGAIGAGVAGGQDALLQNTAINTGIQDEFSWKQAGLSSAAGFGFGTLFGGAFAYGGFKLTNRAMKNQAIKQLEDLHNYGRDTITGKRLFQDLSEKKKKRFYYKNLSKEDIDKIELDSTLKGKDLDEKIKNLRKNTSTQTLSVKGKPPKEKLNYDNMNKDGQIGAVKYIKSVAREYSEQIGTEKISFKEMEMIAEKLGADPKALRKLAKSKAKEDRELFALVIAHKDALLAEADAQLKLSNEFFRAGITEAEKESIRVEFRKRARATLELIQVQKQLQENYARATTAGRVRADKERAAELIVAPEDPQMKALLDSDIDGYIKAVSLLDDDNHVILALQNAKKVDKWDLINEYINNNLLSSPDTHILNLISGFTQSIFGWKSVTMLIRAANLAPQNSARAKELAREALETYIYQFVYTGHALKKAGKAFYLGRPLLDSQQLKYDNSIRQGQLQRWINEMGKVFTQPLGKVGTVIQKGIINPAAYATTFPLRILSAGDEFLKQMSFKARMASQINSELLRTNPELYTGRFTNRSAFIKKFRELEEKYYVDEQGRTKDGGAGITENDRSKVNEPLQFARENTYTQSAYSVNPITGKSEGGVTGSILSWANRNKWSRAFGLHFINTPSNLLKWNWQYLPYFGKFQLEMRHMLAKGADGKYINPEAAAEANARMQMGFLLWTSAFGFAIAGKITGGGSRDWRENKEREANTGWQPYSYVTDDGRHISLNRLDPVFMPFMIAADLVDAVGDFLKYQEELPEEVESKFTELSMAVLASLTRNITSKFYTRNILETANFFFSDDFMKSRSPEYVGSSILARAIYKIAPLSGGLRYASRIQQDEQKEILTFTDRIKQLNPFDGQDRVMPRRNMMGQPIDRKNGWLFGLGGEAGIWSSPFSMTKWGDTEIANFFKGREFNYRQPDKRDRRTALDLSTIKDDKGQTAYDYWLEQKQFATFQYKGKKYKLQDYLEILVKDKSSPLYKLPDGVVAGDDYRQKHILSIIHAAEAKAYAEMWKKYPILEETLKKRGTFIKESFDEVRGSNTSYDDLINALSQ